MPRNQLLCFPGSRGLYDLPIPAYLAIALLLASVLFAPEAYAKGLGFAAFLDQWRPFVGVTFLASLIFPLARGGESLYESARKKREGVKELSRLRKRLHTLTPNEKKALQKFICKMTRVAHFPLGDGVINVLIGEKILALAANNGYPESWPYRIQPWAWDYLLANPTLLDMGDGAE